MDNPTPSLAAGTGRNFLFVIDCGPNCGKTTLVQRLEARGYLVSPEAAAELIKRGIQPVVDDKLSETFQRELISLMHEKEADLMSRTGNRMRVSDRGLLSSLAYYEYHGQPLPDFLQGINVDHYDIVFVLDPVDKWVDDGIRSEPGKLEFTRAINPLFIKHYEQAGVKVVTVPLMGTIEARVDYVVGVIEAYALHIDYLYAADPPLVRPDEPTLEPSY